MESENEGKVENTEEEVIEEETPETELTPETDWEAEAKKARGIAQRLRTKLTKATEKKKEVVVEPVKETKPTGGLDETQLDYLDLKGISDQDEIDIIEGVVAKTGLTVRQALKDEYVMTKLETIKREKEVKKATPSATKRGGGQSNDLEAALAKYESTGKLPDDFKLRLAVVDAKAARENTNKPAWH